jgi:hypothetical protein
MSNSATPDSSDNDKADNSPSDRVGTDNAGSDKDGAPPTNRRGLSTLSWLLPAATFLVGLVIGFAVWGAADDDGDGGSQAQGTPSVTDSPVTGDDNGRTATVTVPQSCLDAIEESEQSLDLLEEAVQAIGDLDAGRLQELVGDLQGASERIRELGEECQELVDVTVGTPNSSPTS